MDINFPQSHITRCQQMLLVDTELNFK